MSRIKVLFEALFEWIFDRPLWTVLAAGALAIVGRSIEGIDLFHVLKEFTTYFRQSVESINAFSFANHVYHAFVGCNLEWVNGFKHDCEGSGQLFLNRGIETVNDQITYWLGIAESQIYEPQGGGKVRFILLPLLAISFVVGTFQSMGLAIWEYFLQPSILGIALLLMSLRLALFVTGAGGPVKATSDTFDFLFEADGLWDMFGNFVSLLICILGLIVVAGVIAYALQWFLTLAIMAFEYSLGGIFTFCATCFGAYNFLKSAESLEELAKGDILSKKSK